MKVIVLHFQEGAKGRMYAIANIHIVPGGESLGYLYLATGVGLSLNVHELPGSDLDSEKRRPHKPVSNETGFTERLQQLHQFNTDAEHVAHYDEKEDAGAAAEVEWLSTVLPER
ncbi:hypothetical protein [Microbacterium hatanonis]|uniref:Uncharacterized protein n=1 Tax=Microbacterium hatanonis TaxID=404366 RepID=A0A5C8I4D6_9MICO|nr:hypothetical protein [Microbacterium hatanonis]TXK13119.1 hypothetical protein FVP77_06760 [Microbacterium hatanonis]